LPLVWKLLSEMVRLGEGGRERQKEEKNTLNGIKEKEKRGE